MCREDGSCSCGSEDNPGQSTAKGPREAAADGRPRSSGCRARAAEAFETELMRPIGDAAVAAGSNVEIPASGGPELGGRRPEASVGAERLELQADAIARPSSLRRRAAREHIPGRGPVTDANEQTRRDQLREVGRSLGAADPGEALILASGQERARPRVEP